MKKKYKGFTIIEILIVISILAILSSVIFIFIPNSKAKARDLIRKNHTSQLYLAIELYNNQVGKLPDFGRPLCLSITEPDPTCYVSSSNLDEKWTTFTSQIAQYVGSVEPDPCPDCTLSQSFLTKVFGAGEDNYEYVYEAPASVLAFINQNGINKETVGFKASSFRIYAKNLEKGDGPYGFGINLGEYDPGGSLGCPYGDDLNKCSEYFGLLCEGEGENSLDACLWLWENNKTYCENTHCKDILLAGENSLCVKGDVNACLWLFENNACEEECINILRGMEYDLCIKKSNLDACLWLWDNSMCEETCRNMLFDGQKYECEENKDFVACEWLWDNNNSSCKESKCDEILIDEKNRLCKDELDENACDWLKNNGF